MNIARVGIDMAKPTFQVYAVDKNNKAVFSAKLSRSNSHIELCD